jgi:hypothetical protein
VESREKIAKYLKKNPSTTRADIVAKVKEHRAEIRQHVVDLLSPEQLISGGKLPRLFIADLNMHPVIFPQHILFFICGNSSCASWMDAQAELRKR